MCTKRLNPRIFFLLRYIVGIINGNMWGKKYMGVTDLVFEICAFLIFPVFSDRAKSMEKIINALVHYYIYVSVKLTIINGRNIGNK